MTHEVGDKVIWKDSRGWIYGEVNDVSNFKTSGDFVNVRSINPPGTMVGSEPEFFISVDLFASHEVSYFNGR